MRNRAIHAFLAGVLVLWMAACAPPEGDEAAGTGAEGEAAPEAVVEKPAPVPVGPAPSWDPFVDQIEPTVRAWAAAWSAQDVAGYLSHYSPSFRPPGGMNRVDWEMQRKVRVTRPSRISVAIEEFGRTGSGTKWRGGRELEVVKVQFRQTYESNTFSDEVLKRLELEYLDDRWQITDEAVR